MDDEREGLDWVLEEWQVREMHCEEEVRTKHCPAAGRAQFVSDVLTLRWARIIEFGDILEQSSPGQWIAGV